jgi:integrase/recombinase XerD
MQQILLKDLISRFDQELIKLNYKQNSLKSYRIFWKQLLKFFTQQKQTLFSEELAYTFLKERYNITGNESNQYLSRNKQHVRQMVRKLIFFHKHGIVGRMNGVPESKIKNKQYLEILKNYITDCSKREYSNTTCKNLKRSAIDLFHFLETNAIHKSKSITSKIILDYINSLKDIYCYRSMGNLLTNLRSFFNYLYEKNYHDQNLVDVLPRQKVQFSGSNPTVWPRESVLKLLNTIDRGNPCGKRDYAIFLLVTLLGIRAGDIRNLKLENLNWNNNTIEFVQSKTSRKIRLPLLKDIGWAIIDYFKNGRPKVESPYVFLKHIAPYDRLKEGNRFYHIIKRCIKISGIIPPSQKNIGMHSLRRSLASSLLGNHTPLQIISDILGHTNTESTSVYLKTGIDMLRECVLDTPEVANE